MLGIRMSCPSAEEKAPSQIANKESVYSPSLIAIYPPGIMKAQT